MNRFWVDTYNVYYNYNGVPNSVNYSCKKFAQIYLYKSFSQLAIL